VSTTPHLKRLFLPSLLLCLLALASCHSEQPTAFSDPAAPPLGLYRCWAGGFDHLPAGTLTLAPDGRYESYRPGGGGSYSFTPASSSMQFLDGDYHYWEYSGVFQPLPQPRIVLMPLDAHSVIGSERPGEFQYCYRQG